MKNKGISLIVLIITIVVVIVLATAIIVNLAQTNIIANANESVVKQDFKTLQEELDLYIADKYVDTLGKFDSLTLNASKTTNPSIYEILTSLEKSKYKDDVIVVNGKIMISEGMNSKIKEWAIEVVGDNIGYKNVKEGDIVTEKNAVTTGIYPTYNNPVIPVGFKAKDTKDASWDDTDKDGIVDDWNNGLVIADENGNEFVWVPVDGTDVTYEKWCTSGISYADTSNDKDALPTVNGSTINENLQIIKYGGFYIGRYEAGVPANQTSIDGTSASTSNKAGMPVVSQGAKVWTNIDYNNANINAKSFVNTDNVKSGIVTGTQWNTAMKWIENSGISITDSRSWGNHSDSIAPANVTGYGSKQATGYSEYWKAKNIYDIAGNTFEWTGEIHLSGRTVCGGCYLLGGYDCSVVSCDSIDPSLTIDFISFRIALYVM